MATRNIYLKIEQIAGYNPVNPEPKPANTLSVQSPPNNAIGRNVASPGYYLLFILDAGRVPSVAKWIRLTP